MPLTTNEAPPKAVAPHSKPRSPKNDTTRPNSRASNKDTTRPKPRSPNNNTKRSASTSNDDTSDDGTDGESTRSAWCVVCAALLIYIALFALFGGLAYGLHRKMPSKEDSTAAGQPAIWSDTAFSPSDDFEYDEYVDWVRR